MIKLQDTYAILRVKTKLNAGSINELIESGQGMFKQSQTQMNQDSKNVGGTISLTVYSDSKGEIGDIVECYGTQYIIVNIWLQEKMMMPVKRYKTYTLEARMSKTVSTTNP